MGQAGATLDGIVALSGRRGRVQAMSLDDDFGARVALRLLSPQELERAAWAAEPDRWVEVARRVFPGDARAALAVREGLGGLGKGLRAIGPGCAPRPR